MGGVLGLPAALVALVQRLVRGLLGAALGTELALVHRAAGGAGPAVGGLGLAALHAELAGVLSAAFALPGIGLGSGSRCRGGLLLPHCEEIRRVDAAGLLGHTETDEAVHCAAGIVGGVLHRLALGLYQGGRGHGRVAHDGRVLGLLDELLVFLGEGDGVHRHGDDLQASELAPLLGQGGVHRLAQVFGMGGQSGGTDLLLGDLGKGGLKGGNELRLELAVDLLAGIFLGHVAADVGVEEQGVGDTVGIQTAAAHGHVDVKADVPVHNAEGNGGRRAELVIDDLLGVEVIHALVLAGVAAEGESLADELEGLLEAGAEAAGKEGGLRGVVPDKFAGFRAELYDLALLHDDHALAVGHGDHRAVGDDVVIAFGVAGASGDALLALDSQNILVNGVTVEKFLPLVRKYAADCTEACCNKSHEMCSFRV